MTPIQVHGCKFRLLKITTCEISFSRELSSKSAIHVKCSLELCVNITWNVFTWIRNVYFHVIFNSGILCKNHVKLVCFRIPQSFWTVGYITLACHTFCDTWLRSNSKVPSEHSWHLSSGTVTVCLNNKFVATGIRTLDLPMQDQRCNKIRFRSS